MTIKVDSVRRTTVGELLEENLQIPSYQRPYTWRPETALQLLEDILAASKKNDVPYVLGTVILHKDYGHLYVVDGQQRLLTLHMMRGLLQEKPDETQPLATGNKNPINCVRTALQRHIGNSGENAPADSNKTLASFITNKCELIRIETDDIDEAFRVFDSQNYRGKQLAPHDLLKAYHLREMGNETTAMTVALVEAWESVGDNELDRLFSTYLYRIARWSRGQSAPRFTAQDIDMFKGISPGKDNSPYTRYHTVAQAAIPVLTLLEPTCRGNDARALERTRFQLEAPLVAGRRFFEMITFMLTELKQLAQEAFTNDRSTFAFYKVEETNSTKTLVKLPSQSRYRYVSELYLAAMLYYTNKFGDEDLAWVRDQLFAWAYALRTGLLRVQYQSIDNLARNDKPEISAFKLIRNAAFTRELRRLPTIISYHKDSPEIKLVEFLNKKGFEINEST